LDIVGGNCYNSTIPQNVTFGYQGYGFGNDSAATSLGFGGSSAIALAIFWFAMSMFL
jgi:hypothetical protein